MMESAVDPAAKRVGGWRGNGMEDAGVMEDVGLIGVGRRHRRGVLAVGVCILAAAGLGGCRSEEPGGVVEATGTAERIVTLAPNLTEIVFALGLGERIVGVTEDSNWPPEATTRRHVGTFWQVNLEAVLAAQPDLVVTLAFPQQRQLAERLKVVSCRCLTVKIDTITELYAAIARIGSATGRVSEAAGLITQMQADLAQIAADVGVGVEADRPKVLWVVQREPLRVAGTETFANEIIRLAGGRNAIGPTMQKYPPIGVEQLMACAPDVIIEPTMRGAAASGGDRPTGDGASDGTVDAGVDRQAALDYWARVADVPAVRNGRVYVVEGDLVSRLGPRLADGVRRVAECVRAGQASAAGGR